MLLATLVLGTAVALRTGVTASNADVIGTLHASVGPDFNISLVGDDGLAVKQLTAGTYVVSVNDLGTAHNFHLTGLGVDLSTSVENTEQVDWTVTLADAHAYEFHCDRHPGTLNGTFNVGDVPPAPPPVLAPPSAPGLTVGKTTSGSSSSSTSGSTSAATVSKFLGTITATVSKTGTITFTKSGKKVSSLKQGSYTLSITDLSSREDFTMRQLSGAQSHETFTTSTFVGKKSTTITLAAGQWKVFSSGRESQTSLAFRVTT
ncbi:MAG: hypothetical protein WCH31_05205 [Actinomycetes bacterium]